MPGWIATSEEGFWWRTHKFKTCCLCRAGGDGRYIQYCTSHGRSAGEVFIQGQSAQSRASSLLALRSLPCLLPLTAPWGVGQPYPGEQPHGGKFRIGFYIRQAGKGTQPDNKRRRTLGILGWGKSPVGPLDLDDHYLGGGHTEQWETSKVEGYKCYYYILC